jgi:hypothetical protein
MISPRFATDNRLLSIANHVFLQPEHDRAVFYAEDIGARRAEDFVRNNPGYTRIDDLLNRSAEGRALFREIGAARGMMWNQREEIWLALSMRMAAAASGTVNCFGPDRLGIDEGVEAARHSYNVRAFAHTQFEKAELPILENSIKVEAILYNGDPLD